MLFRSGNQSAFFGQTDFSGVSPVGIYHSGTWRFIVNNSGYVGIGTIIPQQKLDVVGRLKFRAENSNTAGFWLTGNDGVQTAFVGQLDVTGTSPVGIYHGGDWRLLVNNAGNVGIGTTTPAYKTVISNNGAAGLEIDPAGGQFSEGVAMQTYNRATSAYVPFQIYSSKLTLGGGNVGIGTTTPGSYKLAVAGSIAATGEVRVFTAGTTIFPDYVFDPSYQLLSLEETEKYVKANKHLPEVPSAAEIEKDGMSLNGMNVILLKKVEEITLHLIEMKKENLVIKHENAYLRKRIEKIEQEH